jgi:hypothetical protein
LIAVPDGKLELLEMDVEVSVIVNTVSVLREVDDAAVLLDEAIDLVVEVTGLDCSLLLPDHKCILQRMTHR